MDIKINKLMLKLDKAYEDCLTEHEILDKKMDEAMRTNKNVMDSLSKLAICLGKMQMLTEIRIYVADHILKDEVE
jgi:hypothetical protein